MQKKLTAIISAAVVSFAITPLCSAMDFAVESSQEYVPVIAGAEVQSEEAVLSALFPGEGTKESPYLISKASHFTLLSVQVNNGVEAYNNAYYKLTNDIDFSTVKNYIPIGKMVVENVAVTDKNGEAVLDDEGNPTYEDKNVEYAFQGHFDGDGYALKNLSINSSAKYVGVFGYVKNACFENLRIENINIAASSDGSIYAGALAGWYAGNSYKSGLSVKNCHIDGTLVAESSTINTLAGGMFGVVKVPFNTLEISDCRVDIDLKTTAKTTSQAGGIVGSVETGVYIKNCYVSGSVYGEATGDANSTAGGIAGWLKFSDWIGAASLSEDAVLSADPVSMTSCINDVKVQSVDLYSPRIGNTVGYVYDTTATNCYYNSANSVSNTGKAYAGTALAASKLYDKTFLEGLGFDFTNTWTMILGKPELKQRNAYIAYETDGSLLDIEPVNCGSCLVIASAYDADGRVVASRVASYTEGTPETVSFEGVSYTTIKLFALKGIKPLCNVRIITAE